MSKVKGNDLVALDKAIFALVAALKRPVALAEIKELLSTQDNLAKSKITACVNALILGGQLRLTDDLKIVLAEPLPVRIRADVEWAVAELGRSDRQIVEAVARRKNAIATLLLFSGREFV